MPHLFTAIDFETACHDRRSICQVGLVRVENGQIVKELNLLVPPPGNYYHPIFPKIHGIHARKTANAPDFSEIRDMLKPYIAGQTVVAHNMAFDGSCLRSAMAGASLAAVKYKAQCTYRIFGKALNDLCRQYAFPLHHHNRCQMRGRALNCIVATLTN